MRRLSHKVEATAALTLLVLAAGCARVPPDLLVRDRFDYGGAVAESWKRQTLMNVVRLRYADAPLFLDVTSIINSYSVLGRATAGATLLESPGLNEFSIEADAAWGNTPTVTYQPLTGDRFTRSMLTPMMPTSVFQLLQAGWAVRLVFRTCVSSINGLNNSGLAQAAADPGFEQLIESLSRIQRVTGLAIRVVEKDRGAGGVMVLREPAPGQEADGHAVRDLLKLDPEAREFGLQFGVGAGGGRDLVVLTRSMLEILLTLGLGVDVPPPHQARVLPFASLPGEGASAPLVHIRSGRQAPCDAYASICYQGWWFWIAADDVESKRHFTFLMILFSLAETGLVSTAPLVTVPAR